MSSLHRLLMFVYLSFFFELLFCLDLFSIQSSIMGQISPGKLASISHHPKIQGQLKGISPCQPFKKISLAELVYMYQQCLVLVPACIFTRMIANEVNTLHSYLLVIFGIAHGDGTSWFNILQRPNHTCMGPVYLFKLYEILFSELRDQRHCTYLAVWFTIMVNKSKGPRISQHPLGPFYAAEDSTTEIIWPFSMLPWSFDVQLDHPRSNPHERRPFQSLLGSHHSTKAYTDRIGFIESQVWDEI